MVTANLMPSSAAPSSLPATNRSDLAFLDLTRLLSRLDVAILSSEGGLALQRSGYDRTKAGANLETARNLLVQLEHEHSRAAKASVSPRKEQKQSGAELQEKRILLKQLQDRLFELNHMENDEADASDAASIRSSSSYEEDEDLLSRYAPAHNNTQDGLDQQHRYSGPITAQNAQAAAAAASFASTVRARGAHTTQANATAPQATATSTSISAGRDMPPGQSLGTTLPFAPKPDSLKTHAQLLEAHDTQQDQITSDLLQLASNLKLSTNAFSESLAASDDVVDQAASNLDKNVSGMESASTRMNLLRRATSGWNLFNKMSLYVRIAVLWVAIILLTFVAPKLRF